MRSPKPPALRWRRKNQQIFSQTLAAPEQPAARDKVLGFVSCNGTGAGPLTGALEQVTADPEVIAFFGQEHKLATDGECAAWQLYAKRLGWTASVGHANLTPGGVSAGTAVAVRSSIEARYWPGADGPDVVLGRAAGAHAQCWMRGGIALLSIYMVSGAGVGPLNQELLAEVSYWLRLVNCLVIIGGDWNMVPEQLWGTGWPAAHGLTLLFSEAPTCGERILDFFAVSCCLGELALGIEPIQLGTKPHWGTKLRMAGTIESHTRRTLRRPKVMPIARPIGCPCRPPPRPTPSDGSGCTKQEVTDRWATLIDYFEDAVLAQLGIPAADAAPYKGRAAEPRFVWRTVLPENATRHPRSCQACIEARNLALAVKELLQGWAKHGAIRAVNLARVRRTSLTRSAPELKQARATLKRSFTYEQAAWVLEEADRHTKWYEAQDRRTRNADWKDYVWGLAAKGARAINSYVKRKPNSIAASLEDLAPASQAAVDKLAEDWDKHWLASSDPVQDMLDWEGQVPLPRPSAGAMRSAARTFPAWTGLGADSFHMRAFALLDDDDLELLVDFMLLVEGTGLAPDQLEHLLVVFIPKLSGGVRPIGLVNSAFRLWGRVRRPVTRAFLIANKRSYHVGVSGHTCEQANWRHLVADEVARARGLKSATALLDITKCFEFVRHKQLHREATFHAYPWGLLRLDITIARSKRYCKLDGAFSGPRTASRTIVAGTSGAGALLVAYTLRSIDAVVSAFPKVVIRNIMDDVSIQAIGEEEEVGRDIVGAAELCAESFTQDLLLELQVAKSAVVSAHTPLLALIDKMWSSTFRLPSVDSTRLLGADYSASRRRAGEVRGQRLEDMDVRMLHTDQLARQGVQVTAITQAGTLAGAVWGCGVDGLTPTALNRIRQALGRTTPGTAHGRSLTIDIALTQGKDPFLRATTAPVQLWGAAVWNGWVSIRDLQVGLMNTMERLGGMKSPWAAARSPIDAFVLSMARIGWNTTNCVTVTRGTRSIRLDRVPPAAAMLILECEANKAVWEKLGEQPGYAGLGEPCLAPIRSLLKRSCCNDWTFLHRSALRSHAVGSQWPQQRLYDAGLADTPFCTKCGALGTLLHRCWECPAGEEIRRTRLAMSTIDGLHRKRGVATLFLERALAPDLHHLLPDPTTTPEIHVILEPDDGIWHGEVYMDGSGFHPTDARRRRVGSAATMRGSDGKEIGAMYAPAPLLCQTTPGAEAYALYMVLLKAMPGVPLMIYCDCQDTVDGVGKGREWACDARRAQCALWMSIWTILEDFDIREGALEIIKVKAHTSLRDVAEGLVTAHQRICNGRADELAKKGAGCHRVDPTLERVWPIYHDRIRQVALHVADATVLADADGRDTTAKRPAARKKVELVVTADPLELPEDAAVTRATAPPPEDAGQPAAVPHTLWDAAFTEGPGIVYCSACGAFTSKGERGCARLLAKSCGGPTRGLATQRLRLTQGKYPACYASVERRRMVSRRPAGLAKAPPGVQRLGLTTAGTPRPLPEGTTLMAALAWVGIDLMDVPRLEKELEQRRKREKGEGTPEDPIDDVTVMDRAPAVQPIGQPGRHDAHCVGQMLGLAEVRATRRARFRF
jgi:hypothetical protein